jgi:hypothetical protein
MMPIHSPSRLRVRRRRPATERYGWLAVPIVLAVAATGFVFWFNRPAASGTVQLSGYIESVATLEQEHRKFHGQLSEQPLAQQLAEANRLVGQENFPAAARVLEKMALKTGLPLVHNNLGVLYEKMGDRARAANAFREALARDAGYGPARANLGRLGNFRAVAAEPVSQEVERNDNHLLANVIAMEHSVDATIDGSIDNDYFQFVSPPPPRDVLEIRLENRSKTLAPGLAVFDSDHRFTAWRRETGEPGASLVKTMSAPPNATQFLQVWGHRGSEGAYALSVKALRAFDAFEPNDDIFSSRRISVGVSVDGNIMDDRDTDYFEFVAPRSGAVSIDIENLSSTLIPALSLFSPDRSSAGFGPDARTPGKGLKHRMEVEEGRTHFLQIWSQANSKGAYRLTVR